MRVLEHRGQALGRRTGVERHVGAACQENAEQADDRLHRRLDEEADRDLGADAETPQAQRQALGPLGELPVGEAALLAAHRRSVGGADRLGCEQLGEVSLRGRRRGPAGVVPFDHQLRQLRRGEQRRLPDRPLAGLLLVVGRQDRERPLEVPQPARDGRRVEQRGPVGERHRQLGPGLRHRRRELEARRLGGNLEPGDREPGQGRLLPRRVLQHQHDLEERAERQVAARRQLLDQLLERQLLVSVGLQADLAVPRDQLPPRRLAAEIAGQRQQVDEEADQALGLGAIAVGDRRAHDQPALLRMAREHRLEGGQQEHEESRPFPPRGPPQAGGQLGAEPQLAPRPVEIRCRQARPVGRQLERRLDAGEPPAPAVELPRERVAGEPGALPAGDVGVLDRQLGQAGGPRTGARQRRAVMRRDLAGEDRDRPAIAGDVVHDEEQQVVGGAQAQQADPQQRPARQVEGAARLLPREALGLGSLPRSCQRREIDRRHPQRRPLRRRDHLHRLARDDAERGAQRLVAADRRDERRGQRRRPQVPTQPQHRREVVDRVARRQLIEEPEPLLREGERQIAVARRRRDRRQPGRSVLAAGKARLETRRQPPKHWVGEDLVQGELDPEGRAQARHQLRGQQRVPAESEEVVRRPDLLAAQQAFPDPGEHLLDRPARRGEGRGAVARSLVRLGQRAPVQLAVGGQRQRRHDDEGGGDHVGGQPLLQERAESLRRRAGAGADHHVGHQPPATAGRRCSCGRRSLLAIDDRRRTHRGMAREDCLDLSQLDAEAADLHLPVDAPEELEHAVGAPARQVPGVIEALARIRRHAREGIGTEDRRGQVRAPEIAARQAGAADRQLARQARGHWLRGVVEVEEVEPRSRHRPAERHAPRFRLATAAPFGDRHRGFRRAVAGHEDGRRRSGRAGRNAGHNGGGRERREEARRQVPRHPFPAGDHAPQRAGTAEGLLGEQRRQQRRRQVGVGDPLRGDPSRQVGRVLLKRPVGQDHRGSRPERREDLHHRNVEAEAGAL